MKNELIPAEHRSAKWGQHESASVNSASVVFLKGYTSVLSEKGVVC